MHSMYECEMNNIYTCRMHAPIRCLGIYMSFITGTLMHGREMCRVMADIIMFVIPIRLNIGLIRCLRGLNTCPFVVLALVPDSVPLNCG